MPSVIPVRIFCLAVCSTKNKNMKNISNHDIVFFLHGCETWSFPLRDEHRLTVLENKVLRIFGPKRDEVTGNRRRLHN